MNVTWEESVFAGLEELDDEGQERVSHLGTLDETAADDEPEMLASNLPSLEELQLEVQPPRLA